MVRAKAFLKTPLSGLSSSDLVSRVYHWFTETACPHLR